MIFTKKKMKLKYYHLSGGSLKAKSPKKLSSPALRMVGHIAEKLAYATSALSSKARITRQDYKTRLLSSKLIKERFTNRNKKKGLTPLSSEDIAKLTNFQTKLSEYERDPDALFQYTSRGSFFSKSKSKNRKFSKELRNMIKYMKAKESLRQTLQRFRSESAAAKAKGTTEGVKIDPYIKIIKNKLNLLLTKPTPSSTPSSSTPTSSYV